MLASKNPNVVMLLMILFGGVVGVNLLVTIEQVRYLYWLFSFLILLGVHACHELVVSGVRAARGEPLFEGWLAPALGATTILVVVASWSPWSTCRSYDDIVTSDIDGAVAFVRRELRTGDAVAAQEPHTPMAAIGLGRADYDFIVPMVDGYLYRRNGKIVDRNVGADVISTLEGLEDAIATHDRLWVIVDRYRMPSRGQDVEWEFPAARVEAFLRENFQLRCRTFFFSVFLWDASAGHYRGFRQNASRPL
jgi:hypothetical protein